MGGTTIAAEALLRFLLLCGALALLRWATVARQSWEKEVSSTFEPDWVGWAGWIVLVVASGLMVGAASLARRPGTYRWHVPLVISLPASLLVAHPLVVAETGGLGGLDLPSFLDRYFFYMEPTSQFALAVIVGIGLTAGLQPRGPGAEPEAAIETTRLP